MTVYGEATSRFARGVTVSAGAPMYFTSGSGAGANAPADMRGQALLALEKLKQSVAAAGFTPQDMVFVRACLAPGADGKVDYAGWNEAWTEFFKTSGNTRNPARTTLGVPTLGRPGILIGEIECVCVAPLVPSFAAGSEKLGLPTFNPKLKPYGVKEGRFYAGMGVMPGSALYWTAGIPAPMQKPDAPAGDPEKYGDIKVQTRATLKRLQENLASVGLTFKDVVYLHAWVGPDKAHGGAFDIAGWNAAYDDFFNNADNPHKPARATITTPTFGNSGLMLEVEIIAAFPGSPDKVKFDSTTNPNLKAYGTAAAPISSGVAVKSGTPLYWSAGVGPTIDGNMKTQALSALELLQKRLTEAGLGYKDVIFLRAYVVPEADGNIDRAGWTEAYQTYFNRPDQPHKPARTTIAVQSLPRPGGKIEVEVIAAAP